MSAIYPWWLGNGCIQTHQVICAHDSQADWNFGSNSTIFAGIKVSFAGVIHRILTNDEISIISKWLDDGANDECPIKDFEQMEAK